MPRLFTAILIPDDERAALSALETPIRSARWIDPDDYHITLRFLGDIPAATANAFLANLAAASSPTGDELSQAGPVKRLAPAFGAPNDHRLSGTAPMPASPQALPNSEITLQLSGLGAFGGNRPRTIWAGLAKPGALRQQHRLHEIAARRADCQPDSRRYSPHVTLARLGRVKAGVVADYLGSFGGYVGDPFPVNSFALMSAKPGRGGGPYVVEDVFPFDFARWNR